MAINRRIPVGIAIVTLALILSIWVRRDTIAQHPAFTYIKGHSGTTRETFFEIGTKHGTDKVTSHHYERMYEHKLASLRDKKIKMLEIGLGCDMHYGPGASYYTWLEYFSQVDLYYIEYDAKCAALWANKTDKATIFAGDQADVAFLDTFKSETRADTEPFDIIVDDGGHSMTQQRTSLAHLWGSVKPGGLYFIEDLETSYIPVYGGGGHGDTFMNDLKTILDDMVEYPGNGPAKHAQSAEIISFEFTQGVVALEKVGPYGKDYHGLA